KERDSAEVCDYQIVEAIIVVIADRTADAEARLIETHGGGDIRKGAVAIVPVKLVRFPPIQRGRQWAILYTKQIGPAIAVVVDPTQPAAHRFRHEVEFGGRVEVAKIEACRWRDIFKPDSGRRLHLALRLAALMKDPPQD